MRTRAGLLTIAAMLSGAASAGATVRISARGIGAVTLGARADALRASGRIGRTTAGCPLDPGSRAASLARPLRGSVGLSHGRVSDIYLSGGAARTSRGIGIGSPRSVTLAAYPKAKVDRSTQGVFGITLLTVPRSEGGPLQLGLSTASHRISAIGVPFIPFCD